MRGVQGLAGLLAILATVWLLRVVQHSYTNHQHLDVFHLVVGLAAGALGVAFLWRSLAGRRV